jgi:uncharacterized protein (DUF58 family)
VDDLSLFWTLGWVARNQPSILLYLQDGYVLLMSQFALGVVLMVALWKALRARKTSGFEVTRGETSLTFLYVAYGIVTVIYALVIQVAESAHGYKVLLMALDYAALTYVCFFNSWARNKLIGFYIRIQKD